jgi:hypothetical protein
MRRLVIGVVVALLVSASAGTAFSQTLTKLADNVWCAGAYDPTRGSNFGPCGGK